jgi:hypothetical protein
MGLEREVVDLIYNLRAGVSVEQQIENIRKIVFQERVKQLEKIFKRVNPIVNYLISENDGTRCVFGDFKQKNTFEEKLYTYRCEPIMDKFLEPLDLNTIDDYLFYASRCSEILYINMV